MRVIRRTPTGVRTLWYGVLGRTPLWGNRVRKLPPTLELSGINPDNPILGILMIERRDYLIISP